MTLCRKAGSAHCALLSFEWRQRYSGRLVNTRMAAINSGRRSRQSFVNLSRGISRSRVCQARRNDADFLRCTSTFFAIRMIPAILFRLLSGSRQAAREARDWGESLLRMTWATAYACCNSRGVRISKSDGGSGIGGRDTGASPSSCWKTDSKSKFTVGTRVAYSGSSLTHPNGNSLCVGLCWLNLPFIRDAKRPGALPAREAKGQTQRSASGTAS